MTSDNCSKDKEIEEALARLNTQYDKWEITYCENEHSLWYHFENKDEGSRFDRAKLEDGIQVALILSGRRKP